MVIIFHTEVTTTISVADLAEWYIGVMYFNLESKGFADPVGLFCNFEASHLTGFNVAKV